MAGHDSSHIATPPGAPVSTVRSEDASVSRRQLDHKAGDADRDLGYDLDFPVAVEEEVHIMLEAAPELLSRYALLLEEADDDPGVVAFLGDLAEHVSLIAERIGSATKTALADLEPCLRAVEALASTCDEGAELVAWGFLDSLSDEELRSIAPYFGSATSSAAESLYRQHF